MPTSLQTAADVAQDYATDLFMMQQLLLGVATAALVRVETCTNDGGLTAQGRVTIRPLVNQITGDGTGVPHGDILDVPYNRLQGGDNAVILDPQPGDIGVAVFASRDSSLVKKNREPANPGSFRVFSMADALYLGGMLNGVPTQYVRFSSDGLELVSPTRVRIQAPAIELDGPVTATSTIDADGDVTAAGISVQNHEHTSNTPGQPTSPPLP